jgi:hypothetical protein
MDKRIVLAVIFSATLIFGIPALLGSPYMALLFGDVDLYYELKAIPVAVAECRHFEGDDVSMDFCVDAHIPRIARELRN